MQGILSERSERSSFGCAAGPAALAAANEEPDQEQDDGEQDVEDVGGDEDQRGEEDVQSFGGMMQGNGGEQDGLAPVDGLDSGKKSLAHATFEIVDGDDAGEVAGDEEIAGEVAPVERAAE